MIDYINGANTAINEGIYVSESNAYLNIFRRKGNDAKYFFIGITRDEKNITTFHARYAKRLKRKFVI